ncbi:MAG: hypothetical protein L3J07_00895 [Candidatus Magasanikbacteria bacterium]|nr:hypothetical protein [Candidatus Magasanikbacteria bacterium]
MNTKSLSKKALGVIAGFKELEISGLKISCPYFINKGKKVRAGLKVMIGKGSPEDIKKEIELLALRKKVDLKKLDKKTLNQFFVDNNIGIDCSGFVFYVLDAEIKSRKLGGLKRHLRFPLIKNPLRKILAQFRPIENTNVKNLVHNKNSFEVMLSQVEPGDLIALTGAGEKNSFDHVLIAHKVGYENDLPTIIHYTHSLKWSVDTNPSHGIKEGTIEISDPKKSILEQKWTENKKTGKENETLQRFTDAKWFGIRRLTAFQK